MNRTVQKSIPGSHRDNLQRREDTVGFLCFRLGAEEFGSDLHLIRQIVLPPPYTPVPRTRSYFMGVVSIRGQVTTLVDFRQLIGLEPATLTRQSRVLLFHTEREEFGLVVDAVTSVRRVSPCRIEENPALEENPITQKVIGVVRTEPGTQITLIDLADIMNEALR
jgi:purine-binding chemotaxis protein CheW